jgi:hypothetical protein
MQRHTTQTHLCMCTKQHLTEYLPVRETIISAERAKAVVDTNVRHLWSYFSGLLTYTGTFLQQVTVDGGYLGMLYTSLP